MQRRFWAGGGAGVFPPRRALTPRPLFPYTLGMFRPKCVPLLLLAALAASGAGCHNVYTRMYSPKKIHFTPVKEKKEDKAADAAMLPPTTPDGMVVPPPLQPMPEGGLLPPGAAPGDLPPPAADPLNIPATPPAPAP